MVISNQNTIYHLTKRILILDQVGGWIEGKRDTKL